MFHVWCDRLGKEVMIWPSFIDGIDNTDHGIVVRYQCLCGKTAEMLTGSRAAHELAVHVPA